MVYSLLVDQVYSAWDPMLRNDRDEPVSLRDMRQMLDDDIAARGAEIEAEPAVYVWPADLIASIYFDIPEAEPGEPLHVTKIRNPRAGKPDPKTWGWQSSPDGGQTPPGLT